MKLNLNLLRKIRRLITGHFFGPVKKSQYTVTTFQISACYLEMNLNLPVAGRANTSWPRTITRIRSPRAKGKYIAKPKSKILIFFLLFFPRKNISTTECKLKTNVKPHGVFQT